MEFNIKEGIGSVTEMTVTENETASKYGSGDFEVFASPAMIALMENTAKSCVGLHLPCGYSTVGTEINIKHIKATPVGMRVRCEVLLAKVEGKKLYFNVEVSDDKGKIGEGTHVRYIVNCDDFMKKTIL